MHMNAHAHARARSHAHAHAHTRTRTCTCTRTHPLPPLKWWFANTLIAFSFITQNKSPLKGVECVVTFLMRKTDRACCAPILSGAFVSAGRRRMWNAHRWIRADWKTRLTPLCAPPSVVCFHYIWMKTLLIRGTAAMPLSSFLVHVSSDQSNFILRLVPCV